MPKIKNIIIFVAIVAILILIYIFFVQPALSNQASLVSSTSSAALPSTDNTNGSSAGVATSGTSPVGQDFLSLLLNVKNIKLDNSIFSDPAFINLHDSSITLTPDAVIGRPNPFAQLGSDPVPVSPTTPTTSTTPSPILTPATPTPATATKTPASNP